MKCKTGREEKWLTWSAGGGGLDFSVFLYLRSSGLLLVSSSVLSSRPLCCSFLVFVPPLLVFPFVGPLVLFVLFFFLFQFLPLVSSVCPYSLLSFFLFSFFFFLSPLLSLVRGLSLAFIRLENAWFCKAWGPR